MRKNGRHLLLGLYRLIQARMIAPFLLPFFLHPRRVPILSDIPKKAKRQWFHAASVGELETLWPLIVRSAHARVELIVTLLSPSAAGTLEKLKRELGDFSSQCIYMGYAPWEGQWARSLRNLKPDIFITAKYEAWPDLWASLEELDIPIGIVSVKLRRSLELAKKACLLFRGRLPRLLLFPVLNQDARELQDVFPNAKIEVTGEPRWERVFERIKKGSVRAQELIKKYEKFEKPWGVVGSAWMEDLHVIAPSFKQMKGTLWVVPHQVDTQTVEAMEAFLRLQLQVPQGSSLRTSLQQQEILSPPSSSLPKCVLVDEMGFLTELYSVAHWAFVGGGYGAGLHSTLEPAVYGIPIAGGPYRALRFAEVTELMETGQLRLISSSEEWGLWHSEAESQLKFQGLWKAQAEQRLGASQKILASLEKEQGA